MKVRWSTPSSSTRRSLDPDEVVCGCRPADRRDGAGKTTTVLRIAIDWASVLVEASIQHGGPVTVPGREAFSAPPARSAAARAVIGATPARPCFRVTRRAAPATPGRVPLSPRPDLPRGIVHDLSRNERGSRVYPREGAIRGVGRGCRIGPRVGCRPSRSRSTAGRGTTSAGSRARARRSGAAWRSPATIRARPARPRSSDPTWTRRSRSCPAPIA